MRSKHSIQKAKRKRQRKQHNNQSAGQKIERGTQFDASVLLIHGVGNQKPNALIDKWGKSILEEIENLSSKRGWKFETRNSGKTTLVSLTKNKTSRTISLSECIWSDKFKRPGRREMFVWLLARLPAILFLLLPDSRDFNSILGDSNTATKIRLAANFAIRLLLFVGIISWTGWVIKRISQSMIGIGTLIVLASIILLLGLTFHSHWNFAAHVKVASDLDSEELEKVTKLVQKTIENTQFHSRSTTIVAHSQGGLLAHDALVREGGARNPGLRLFGVGSGLRPITLFRVLRKWPGVVFIWSWSLFFISTSFLFQYWTYSPYVLQLCLVNLRILVIENLSLLSMRLAPVETWYYAIYNTQAPTITDFFNFNSTLPELLLICVVSLISLLLSQLKLKAYTRRISDIPKIDWTEMTTPHDIVGRFPFPPLPSRVREIIIPAEGNPVSDHTRYFNRGALTPRIIAASVLSDLNILPIDGGVVRYEAVSKSFLERTRKRWRLVSLISLGTAFPSLLVMAIFPPNVALLVNASMLFCFVSMPLRFGQYIVNYLKQNADMQQALEEASRVPRPRSNVTYLTAVLLLLSSGLGFLGGIQWIWLIGVAYFPATFTPFVFLIISLVHFIWAAILAADYKPNNVVLLLFSAVPLLRLLLIDKVTLWPEAPPIGLLHCIVFLAVSIFAWVAPLLRMFRTAKRADSSSGT